MVPERALLLVGHGTIADPEDAREFLRRIRRGRPAAPEFVAEIERRYRRIGRSPLLDVTGSVASAIERELDVPVHVAMRFWSPLIPDVLEHIVKSGVRELCVLPLAPFSVHVYVGVVEEALAALASRGALSLRLVPVLPYGSDAALVGAHAASLAPLLSSRSPEETELLFTAHSLPLHVLAAGDPYRDQFEAGARAVCSALGWPARIVYQSQGEGGGEWLGPTLAAALDAASAAGKRHVVVAPIGFLADHVETLYDLDVEAAEHAATLGLSFLRAPALNDGPALVRALSAIVRRAFDSSK